eukprot:4515293-Pyramimonas_sp.AAC.1
MSESQVSKADEGGEAFFVEGHRQAQYAGSAQAFPDLAVPSCNALDGFLPITLHMKGYSIVLVLYYGLQKSQGVVGDDAKGLT